MPSVPCLCKEKLNDAARVLQHGLIANAALAANAANMLHFPFLNQSHEVCIGLHVKVNLPKPDANRSRHDNYYIPVVYSSAPNEARPVTPEPAKNLQYPIVMLLLSLIPLLHLLA